MSAKSHLLEVRDLEVRYETERGSVNAVNGISFTVAEGEAVGFVGESGCGKSATALSLLGLIPEPPGRIVDGTIVFRGRDLLSLSEAELRSVRGREIGMIFQDPMRSLNPVLPISRQIGEVLELHMGLERRASRKRAIELLDMVGIPDARSRVDDYPHQFSGGMRQRIVIAMALSCEPQLLVADEPTTALDVTIQAQILDLINSLRRELDMGLLLISHDLGVVARMDSINVMYAGYIVERAVASDLFNRPRHPYTVGLLNAVPRIDQVAKTEMMAIEGHPPNLMSLPVGCPFRPRCSYAVDDCRDSNPVLERVDYRHEVACWNMVQ